MKNNASTKRSAKAAEYLAVAERVLKFRKSESAYQLAQPLFQEWWIARFKDGYCVDEENYECIALSLCFMAAMVKAGDA